MLAAPRAAPDNPAVENRVEAAIAAHAEHAPGCDAVIIAAFGDPGLWAAKEMPEIPVVEEDDAEVIVLGGGPIAGLARGIADRLPVPIVDGVSCAVRVAEALVGLGLRKATRGSLALPPTKPARGLATALQQRITGKP